jgi:hypothetical protein
MYGVTHPRSPVCSRIDMVNPSIWLFFIFAASSARAASEVRRFLAVAEYITHA